MGITFDVGRVTVKAQYTKKYRELHIVIRFNEYLDNCFFELSIHRMAIL